MKTYRTLLVAVTALLASACGSGDAEPSLNHYGDEMTEAVESVQESLSSHHDDVLEEVDLGRMRDMERMHMDDMGMRMGRMQDAQDSMELCGEHMGRAGTRSAAQPFHEASGAMAETVEEASAEMGRHSRAMQDATDVDSALAEEHQHQRNMDLVLDRMRMTDESLAHAMQAMVDAGMSMMCPMGSHMHRRH